MKQSIKHIALLALIGAISQVALADDWPQFRGPSGDGTTAETKFPTSWSPTENILWKVSLQEPGNGSPIVTGKRLLIASGSKDGTRRSLVCFDRTTGAPLWDRDVQCGKEETHQQNPFGSTTPATDGARVVVWHGSAGLHCYDLSGQPLWSRDLGAFKHYWGYGTSPVIDAGRVILHTGPGARVFVTALDLASGKTLWETEEPQPEEGKGEKRADGGDMGSWATPIVAEVEGKKQIICPMPTRVVGYDGDTGEILWWCGGLSGAQSDVVSSSVLVRDGIGVITGDLRGPALGFRLGGAGDVTATHRLWLNPRNPSSVGTGMLLDGYYYRPNSKPGTVDCFEAKTGKKAWSKRAGRGDFWASMVLAQGMIYATNQKGTTVIFRPSPEKLDVVASNELDGPCNATPAFSDGQIFIRTYDHLYCIGE
jgi:outer membrane protein assembly factor BamB